MTMFGRALAFAPLVGALVLAGCGGGEGSISPTQNQQAGVAVGEPNGGSISPAVTAEFIKMAQEASCSELKSRLFVIDGKQMFWDRAGNCPDNSYSQALFGNSTQQVLCSRADSIAGPKTFCADDKSRELFDTIQKNLDKADLGLVGHKVEQVSFLPKSGAAIPFQRLAADFTSGVSQSRQVVIKDAASFAKLWAEHGNNRVPAPAMPSVDFSHQMVLAVFAGQMPTPCYQLTVNRVASQGDKILVEYDVSALQTFAACAQVVSTPMQMVAIERNDAPVEFAQTSAGHVSFATVDQGTRSGVTQARNVVIKDLAGWTSLWAEHAGADAPVPMVNFSKQMVIGVFLGTQANGCYSTNINAVGKLGNMLYVSHTDSVPGMGVMCTMQITTPAHLITVDRADVEVQFTTVVAPVK